MTSCSRFITVPYCWAGLMVAIRPSWPRCNVSSGAAKLLPRWRARGMKSSERGGNAAPWKQWKAKGRLPTVPTGLGNRCCDSHIPTAPTRRGKVQNQNQVSHFPTRCLYFYLAYGLRPMRSCQCKRALRSVMSVTHVAGLKCYPCPRPYTSDVRGRASPVLRPQPITNLLVLATCSHCIKIASYGDIVKTLAFIWIV